MPVDQRALGLSLDGELLGVLALAEKPAGTPEELEANLRQVYGLFLQQDLTELDVSRLRDIAPSLMTEIFDVRQRLRDKIQYWETYGYMTRPVQAALRDLFRIMRYTTDMLGEAASDFEEIGPRDKPMRAFTGTAHNTHVRPAYAGAGNLPFRLGDVLVVRGRAHNSAAIARIGDVDTQFSHTGIVYIDGSGAHWLVQALIEEGSVITPLNEALAHGVARAVLYRHRDAALAARAASMIYARVARSHRGWFARRILYDFTMRLKGTRELFCSKLVHQAFKDASGGAVLLPPYKTRLDLKNKDFFKRIGVRAAETYAPGDIDLDPAFELVAEWQDYRVTPDLRLQDMVMTKVFEWMDGYNARFKGDWQIYLISVFGRFSSYLFESVKDMIASVVPKVPPNMTRRCIATIAMLHHTGEALMPGLRTLQAATIRNTGRPLHPRDALAHLEQVRYGAAGRIGYLHW